VNEQSPQKWGLFIMIKVERYKLFFNSKDFEKIYNQSISEIIKQTHGPYESFFKEVVLISLSKNHCFILFENDNPIGYEIVKIKNKKIEGGFTFILPEHRGKKYSFLLREKMFDLLKTEIDEFSTFIKNSNVISIENAKKTAEIFNFNLHISDSIITPDGVNTNIKKYTIFPK